MPSAKRLGGFKILWDGVHFSLFHRNPQSSKYLLNLCMAFAKNKLNLPFFTCGFDREGQYISLIVEGKNAKKAEKILDSFAAKQSEIYLRADKSAILSIFPHQSKPEIAWSLLEAFLKNQIMPSAIANSNAAISAVIKEELAPRATKALFGPFCFSAYRTPEDWKLSREGKEKIYRDVIASYQEKRPKVYSLDWYLDLELFQARSTPNELESLSKLLGSMAESGLNLRFIVSTPSAEDQGQNFFLAFPRSGKYGFKGPMAELISKQTQNDIHSVAAFSMNGPHFGDRYGIAALLLECFHDKGLRPIALGCTVASIMGLMATPYVKAATTAIKSSFDVPTVTEKRS
ncbi:MAG: hypothetical protein JRJ13_04245 [Deltaproteobacteria bacterium]|nr:hypothetical protein [Deltaproteobacteria bacterium]MBW2025863.1 hypothetical protein [Deltaproteobacteria bacterium]